MVVSLSATTCYRLGKCIVVVGDTGSAILKSNIVRIVIISETRNVVNSFSDGDIR